MPRTQSHSSEVRAIHSQQLKLAGANMITGPNVINLVYQVHHYLISIKQLTIAYQRLTGGWDSDIGDDEQVGADHRVCEGGSPQNCLVNVSILSKDMVTPYRQVRNAADAAVPDSNSQLA